MSLFTPIFIPGLLCTEFLFAKQRATLKNAGLICDTRSHDSINEMAQVALDQCTGALVPIGLSMGGYVALEMARIAPERIAGMALLSTNAGVDNDERANARRQAIKLVTHKGFKGITRSFLSKLICNVSYTVGDELSHNPIKSSIPVALCIIIVPQFAGSSSLLL